MLEDLRAALAPVSALLTQPGWLNRNGSIIPVRLNPHKQPRPARAGQTGGRYDALFRMHLDGTRPLQNDQVSIDAINWWIIWRIQPSPLETHALLECMALPTDIVVPVALQSVPDGIGGHTTEAVPVPGDAFAAKVRSASSDRLLTAQADQLGRLAILYPLASAPDLDPGARLSVRGRLFSVMSLGTDDENPEWGRAVLASED